jgi:hypothetical protein
MSVIDSTIHLIPLAKEYASKEEWWRQIHKKYGIRERKFYSTEKDNFALESSFIDKNFTNSFFILMFNAFEHSFRGMSREFDNKIYPLNPNLGVYFPNIMSKLNLLKAEMNTIIEIVPIIRNSIHNNGVFVSTKGNSTKSLPWKNKTYNFYNGTIINVDDVWPSKPKKFKKPFQSFLIFFPGYWRL